jgi:SAM-dependent methyltransferase
MKSIINLGMHPYADTFIPEEFLGNSEPVYPLECFLDEETGHVSLGYETDPEERYNLYPYSYTSSNSKVARDHWRDYQRTTCEKLNISEGAVVIEVGCNDGFLTKLYKDAGCTVLGIDPSKQMTDIAEQNGVTTKCMVFSEESSKNVTEKADLVVANNVFNHANSPVDFALGIRNILKEDGVFVFQVPYWLNTIKDRKFDQIYHEHPSYFTVKSSCNILKKAGLNVFDVEVVDYHGGSIRVYCSKDNRQKTDKINQCINEETKEGLFDVKRYERFMRDLQTTRDKFLRKLYKVKSKGYPIVAVGAAAKGNTFLNYYNLDSSVVDYVTDSSPHKVGKRTPLTRIPIDTDERVFSKYDKVYAIVLSWNISDMLISNLKKINKNIYFLKK